MSSGAGVARIGRYEVVKAIASGGMATVYLGRALGAGGFERLVAIKAMHPHIQRDPEFVAMFLDEARLAARVRHPNVVPTIDVQEEPLFLVMEYVEGPSAHAVLRALGKRGEGLPIGIALRIIVDTLNGLHAAHDLKGTNGAHLQLVHRDVSPQNILVGVDGIARITDFGVAQAESRLSSTRGGQVKGKIGYMAPEQVRSEPADRRSDTYAAAVVLWELLTGRPLFMADNEAALVAQVSLGTTRTPREQNPLVPEAIDRVCMKALAVEPADRYAGAAEFADSLEEAARLDGVAIASARAVAAFVRELGAHEAPDAPARPSARPLPASFTSGGSSPGADPPRPPTSSTPGTTGALAATLQDGAPTSARPRWQVPAAMGALALVAIGVAWFALRGGAEAAAPQPAASPVVASPVAPPEPPKTPPPAAPVESSDPSPATSATLAASSRPAPSAPPRGGPLPGGPRPGSPPGKPTSFRPSGL